MKKAKIKLIQGRRKGRDEVEIYCYFGVNGKIYLDTGFRINEKHWDAKKGIVKLNHPNSHKINLQLSKLLRKLEEGELDLTLRGQEFTPELAKIIFNGLNVDDFTTFCQDQLTDDNSLKPDSKRQQQRFIGLLKEFRPGGIRMGDISYQFIKEWDNFLRNRFPSSNTVKRFHTNMKKFIRLAINYKHLSHDDNPYHKFKTDAWKPKTEFLYPWELKKLETAELPDVSVLSTVRDVFLFACYTSLRWSDVHSLQASDFEQRDEGLVLNMEAKKTDSKIFLRLYELFDGKPERIIQPYLDKYQDEKYIWGRYIGNAYMNLILKDLMTIAGIEKNLTIHLARHTFGTLYAKDTGNLFQVMAAMSIRSYKTAQVYINLAAMV